MKVGTDSDPPRKPVKISLLSSVVLLALLPWPNIRLINDTPEDCCSNKNTVVATREVPSGESSGNMRQRRAADRRTAEERTRSTRPPLTVASRDKVVFGDRLKVQFIETVGVPVGKSGSNDATNVTTIFPRTDLSGDVTVLEDGSITIAKLGRFAAEASSTGDLQADLEQAFRKAFGRPCDVTISIVDRKPIYVLGDVRAPGVFKHTPGMVVLNVLASAGGPSRGGTPAAPDTSTQIEHVREIERLQQKRDLMTRLLVKQGQLAAQRTQQTLIVLPPAIRDKMAESSPPGTMTSLIASAAVTLAAIQSKSAAEHELADRQVTIAKDDVEAHTRRADQLRDLLAKKQQRLGNIRQIAGKGSVPQYNVLAVEIEVSDAALKIEDEAIAIAQAQRREAEAEEARNRLTFDDSAKLEAEWAATLQEIDDCNQAIRSMEAVVRITDDDSAKTNRPDTAIPSITITRRVEKGTTNIAADEMTEVLPGDVIRVNGSANGIAQQAREADTTKRTDL